MKRSIAHLLICMLMIVCQTVILPFYLPCTGCLDLLLLFVVYCGLFLPFREALATAILLALLMDGVSAAPFGVYLITYMTLCCLVRWLIHFFRPDNPFLVVGITWLGICLENAMMGISILLMTGAGIWTSAEVRLLVRELLLSGAASPVAMSLLKHLDRTLASEPDA
ncbi:MAG: hypothetical protein CSA22_00690 [Deltaproteobacteria bacterium]|nr:MAG: hypothetical protein CSA22_00690 [Deltaproteobacteria bacterium]